MANTFFLILFLHELFFFPSLFSQTLCPNSGYACPPFREFIPSSPDPCRYWVFPPPLAGLDWK